MFMVIGDFIKGAMPQFMEATGFAANRVRTVRVRPKLYRVRTQYDQVCSHVITSVNLI